MTDPIPDANDPTGNGPRDPVLRVVPMPADINTNGHIFGGWVLSQMDIAGGIVAHREAQGPTATVAIDAMAFIAPILLRDIVSVYARVERRGRTSLGIRIEVIATRDDGRKHVKVTEALFTFVALDEQQRPPRAPAAATLRRRAGRRMTRFTVNGQAVHYRMDPNTPLLWALRDASNLTGTKYGCGAGLCGACTVHIDGAATRSCQVPIGTIEGSFVTTIEALSHDRGHPLQQAWVAQGVPQCGYCQSGMIMAAAALLARNPNPSDADIDGAMTNICRCGTYPRIRRAIRQAARVTAGTETIAAAPPPGIDPADAARTIPALTPLAKTR